MNIEERLNGKKILIWGYGREGKSTEAFINRCCDAASVTVYEGDRGGIKEENYDLIIKSPGIVMDDDDERYTSQTELFLGQYRDRTIGITGTKGKSTTATLLYTVLKECSGKNVVLVGNIGCPCLDFLEEITEDTIIVYEMSCHQLAHTKISPHIAVFLNLYEEHLDYYKTMERYLAAKGNIARYQTKQDYFLMGDNVPEIKTDAETFKILRRSGRRFPLSIIGEHNQYNAEFVYKIACGLLGLDEEKVLKSMRGFKGLAHRLEYIGQVGDISFYDDSIATIPEATINAVNSLPDVGAVLIGGMDRKICYDILIDFIHRSREIQFILCYESGKRIYQSVCDYDNCHYVTDLREAVRLAKRITEKGKSCLLSPASASYGYFKNFEERGDMFKKYVLDTER